ncbi:hypothetical protein [Actinomadura rupiterrae]|uniref:hypothetical protein n=1 Tax=Actinomadura rupiterrae TaxID=559627 RepID=UPI0020A365A8|nr:hypothetical protein [Actinomadura rupiterrae]MCP2334787.1 hypothetical protein [Actinomadura rupiterrae]
MADGIVHQMRSVRLLLRLLESELPTIFWRLPEAAKLTGHVLDCADEGALRAVLNPWATCLETKPVRSKYQSKIMLEIRAPLDGLDVHCYGYAPGPRKARLRGLLPLRRPAGRGVSDAPDAAAIRQGQLRAARLLGTLLREDLPPLEWLVHGALYSGRPQLSGDFSAGAPGQAERLGREALGAWSRHLEAEPEERAHSGFTAMSLSSKVDDVGISVSTNWP